MATAYTSLLGLALPVTGELSGTWGDTVNNSITSLLDSAIAGTTTLNTDADVTLTTTTGTANTAREAILLWTAGGTVTRNITAPAQSKAYIVINASTSTQSIVLRGAGPTTGVTIIKGEGALCAWNGTDFIKISNISGAGLFSAITNTSLTSGRVVYSTTGGLETDSANLLFDGTTLTANTLTANTLTATNSANLPNTFGFKNRIINGAMVIDQRNAGASQTITSGSTPYTVDRWLAFGNGANITSQQVAGTGQFQKALQFTGAASVSQALVRQRIEALNTSDLSGATVTIQAYVWGSASGTVNMTLYYPSATDNYTSQTTIVDTPFSITTTPTLYTFVVTSLPSGVLNGLEVRFTYGAIGAGVTRTITGVQLEKGSTATSFDYRPYGAELALCQRYAWKYGGATSDQFAAGVGLYADGNVIIFGQIMHPVTLRATPSMTVFGAPQVKNNGGATTGFTAAISAANQQNTFVSMTKASHGISPGVTTNLNFGATSDYLIFSAEL